MEDDELVRERPRERLRASGVEALSVPELVALVIRTGAPSRSALHVAEEALARLGSLEGLARAAHGELASIPGIGPAKAASLRAALELGARRMRAPLAVGAKLCSPEQVAAHFASRMLGYRQEVFVVVMLDSRHRVIGDREVSRGSLNQSLVHPREVFAPALRESAAAILVLHNHPSGDPEPSREDLEVTRRLVRAGEILGIRVLDHLIVAGDQFRSLARDGHVSASSD